MRMQQPHQIHQSNQMNPNNVIHQQMSVQHSTQPIMQQQQQQPPQLSQLQQRLTIGTNHQQVMANQHGGIIGNNNNHRNPIIITSSAQPGMIQGYMPQQHNTMQQHMMTQQPQLISQMPSHHAQMSAVNSTHMQQQQQQRFYIDQQQALVSAKNQQQRFLATTSQQQQPNSHMSQMLHGRPPITAGTVNTRFLNATTIAPQHQQISGGGMMSTNNNQLVTGMTTHQMNQGVGVGNPSVFTVQQQPSQQQMISVSTLQPTSVVSSSQHIMTSSGGSNLPNPQMIVAPSSTGTGTPVFLPVSSGGGPPPPHIGHQMGGGVNVLSGQTPQVPHHAMLSVRPQNGVSSQQISSVTNDTSNNQHPQMVMIQQGIGPPTSQGQNIVLQHRVMNNQQQMMVGGMNNTQNMLPANPLPNVSSPSHLSTSIQPPMTVTMSSQSSNVIQQTSIEQQHKDDETLYREKVQQLSKYIEPLKRMIARLGNEDSVKLSKMKKLMDVLSNPNQRLAMDTLMKCEKVLIRMNLDTSTSPAPSPGQLQQPHSVMSVKSPNTPASVPPHSNPSTPAACLAVPSPNPAPPVRTQTPTGAGGHVVGVKPPPSTDAPQSATSSSIVPSGTQETRHSSGEKGGSKHAPTAIGGAFSFSGPSNPIVQVLHHHMFKQSSEKSLSDGFDITEDESKEKTDSNHLVERLNDSLAKTFAPLKSTHLLSDEIDFGDVLLQKTIDSLPSLASEYPTRAFKRELFDVESRLNIKVSILEKDANVMRLKCEMNDNDLLNENSLLLEVPCAYPFHGGSINVQPTVLNETEIEGDFGEEFRHRLEHVYAVGPPHIISNILSAFATSYKVVRLQEHQHNSDHKFVSAQQKAGVMVDTC